MSGLNSTDITKIISACGKNGVKTLKYQGLELYFGENEVELSGWEPIKIPSNIVEVNDKIEDNGVTEHHDPVTEEEIEELKISNPLGYMDIMDNA